MGHTQGDWKVNDTCFARCTTYRGKQTGGRTFIVSGEELGLLAEVQGDTQEEAEATAQHILDCYYACKGITPSGIKDVIEAGKKLVKWLHKLADDAEQQARTTRFITMKEAWEADTKNYRATAQDMEQALANVKGEK